MTNSSNRTEFIAIPVVVVVLGILFALMLASDVGVWAWIVSMAALVVLGALAIGIIVRRHRHPAAFDAPATATSASTSDAYRILVIADESLTQRALEDEIAPHAGERAVEALVLAPALRSRLAHWTGDDSQQDEAERHLADTLKALAAAGVPARGELGSDDPIQAADDGLLMFAADEVVFVTGSGDANWLEQGILEVARARYDTRISHIETGAGG